MLSHKGVLLMIVSWVAHLLHHAHFTPCLLNPFMNDSGPFVPMALLVVGGDIRQNVFDGSTLE